MKSYTGQKLDFELKALLSQCKVIKLILIDNKYESLYLFLSQEARLMMTLMEGSVKGLEHSQQPGICSLTLQMPLKDLSPHTRRSENQDCLFTSTILY